MTAQFILASGSPRRRQMLTDLGLQFEVRPADIDETPAAGEAPANYVLRLAREKAAAVAPGLVLAADTTVDFDGQILGKPADRVEAIAMLQRLSGRHHFVHTGVALGERSFVCSTLVTFRVLPPAEIEWYVDTGEPYDKAGAYGMQGRAASMVASLTGSATNVIGLPLAETVDLLRAAGIIVMGDSGRNAEVTEFPTGRIR